MIGGSRAPAVGAALSVVLWLILAVLAAVEGYADKFLSLQAMGIHARMLVAVPLIFLCQASFDQAVRDALAAFVNLGIIAEESRSALDKEAQRLVRLCTSWGLQFGLLAAVVIFSIFMPPGYLPGVSSYAGNATAASDTVALQWYWLVCLPIFRFVMARFLWLLCMWSYLVWRTSRADLRLTAEHPDRLAGLGLVEVAQERLLIFVVAVAVIDAAALAETSQIVALNEPHLYLNIFLVTLIGLVVMCGPLLFLVGPLYRCQRANLVQHSAFAYNYANRFRQQWLAPDGSGKGDLLASGEDIQALDALEVYERVRTMRILPVTTRLFFVTFACAAGPHLPLLLLKYPMTDLVSRIMQLIIGI